MHQNHLKVIPIYFIYIELMSDKYIIEIKTEHAQPIKTLFEVLKEVLEDVNIEIKRDDTIPVDAQEDSDSNSDSETETETETETESEYESDESENSNSSESESSDEDNDKGKDKDKDKDKEKEKENKENLNNEVVKKKRGYLKIMAVDPTKSIFIHLKLDSMNFTKFRCKNEKKNIGINLIYFHRLIKSMDKDDNLTLFIKNNDDQNLWIKRYNSLRKKETLDHMNLIDLNKNKYSVPPTAFEAVVKMPASEFHKVCREMSNIAEFVEIQCINDKILFKCKGDHAGRTVTFTNNDDDDDDKHRKGCVRIKHSPSDPNKPLIVKEIYDLKNITLFNKFTSLCSDVQLYMKNEYPLVVRYTVATLGHILVCFTPVKLEEYKFEDEAKLYDANEVEYLE
jgi:proliferating cell nuclear antigen